MSIAVGSPPRLASLLSAIQLAALKASLRAGEYNLFLGAGASLDATNAKGPLPSGSDLKRDLCNITGARDSSTLQRVFAGLTADQVKEHITDRFAECEPGPTGLAIPTFVWRRIFTLNVDDVLEAAYTRPGNLQSIRTFNFRDTYEELRTLDIVPVVHLHGWAKQPGRGYVFARSEYARLMAETNAWMTVLADVMPVEPFIISGTALDEIDLEFYLARRNSESQREDRGPSFFVEPYPDKQTESECERYGLTLFVGTLRQFLQELDIVLPTREAPLELVAAETRDLFPSGAPQSVVLSFSTDFDRVPSDVAPQGTALKFSYGTPPEWADLAANWDVGRRLGSRLRSTAEAMIAHSVPERLLVVLDDTGAGKSTVLRRVAYDLAQTGHIVLDCSALSRLDPQSTAEAIDLIDDPIVIIVDNLAEQAASVANVIGNLEKPDVVFLCAERNYRERHILRSIGDIPHRLIDGLTLTQPEAMQLVQGYVKRGLTASERAIRFPAKFASNLVGEPIAVACCHILNDMRPLDSIVQSTFQSATQVERDRYLIAALAQFCFGGGVRYEILSARAGRDRWVEQFRSAHPLPLDYYDGRKNFVVPLNATIAVRTLERAPAEDVAKAFVRLALGVAARVNRDAIRRRTPEARLAGRLFDYEDVIRRFLKEGAGAFYAEVQPAWQWNSRYWEQVALYHLSKYRNERDDNWLKLAVQHARHAVAIEPHPYPLTTLGKVLLAQIGQPGMSISAIYSEAEGALTKAIETEQARGRVSVHAYVTLFRGAANYIERGEELDNEQHYRLREFIASSRKYFPRDRELRELADELQKIM